MSAITPKLVEGLPRLALEHWASQRSGMPIRTFSVATMETLKEMAAQNLFVDDARHLFLCHLMWNANLTVGVILRHLYVGKPTRCWARFPKSFIHSQDPDGSLRTEAKWNAKILLGQISKINRKTRQIGVRLLEQSSVLAQKGDIMMTVSIQVEAREYILTYDKNEKEFRCSLVSTGYFFPPYLAFSPLVLMH
jgi:hypothetical protein